MSEETETLGAVKRDKLGRISRPLVQSKSLTIRLGEDELKLLDDFRELREDATGGGHVTRSTAMREAMLAGIGKQTKTFREAMAVGAFDAEARVLLDRVYEALGNAEGVVRKMGTNELQVLRKLNGGDALTAAMQIAVKENREELHAITALLGEIAEAVSNIGGGGE